MNRKTVAKRPRASSAEQRMAPVRRAGIVVPVFNGYESLVACLECLARHTPAGVPIVLVDDASTDSRVAPVLRAFARDRPRTRIVRRECNGGFAQAVNDGVGHALRAGDLVILNADTQVTPGWLEGLARAIDATPGAGIACPLSNHATIVSAPRFAMPGPLPRDVPPDAIAQWLRLQPPPTPAPWLPTAVGFCMYVTREAWTAAGPLDVAFGRGYGEECDLSMRLWARGLRIVCATEVFVAHAGSASFGEGPETAARRRIAEALMDARWPMYRNAVATFLDRNPLRERLEAMRRWLAERKAGHRKRVVHVVHRWGRTGGVENVIASLAALAPLDFDHVVLVPGSPAQSLDWQELEHANGPRVVALRVARSPFAAHVLHLDDDDETLARYARALCALAPDVVHIHHFLGWNTLRLVRNARSLGMPVLLTLHDYLLLCPNYNFARAHGLPCEKAKFDSGDRECRDCLNGFVGANMSHVVERLRLDHFRGAAEDAMAAADRIVTPSEHARRRFARGLPSAIAERISVLGFEGMSTVTGAHEAGPDAEGASGMASQDVGGRRTITFLGAFSFAKGADLFVAAARRLAPTGMRFGIVGPIDPAYAPALRELGIPHSGSYRREELPDLLAGTDVVCLLSRWEETYGLTLDEALASRCVVIVARSGAWTARASGLRGVVQIPPSDHGALIAALQDVDERLVQAARMRSDAPVLADSRGRWLALYRSLAATPAPIGRSVSRADVVHANEALRASLPRAGAPIDQAIGDPAYAKWMVTIDAWRPLAGKAPATQRRRAMRDPVRVLVIGDDEHRLEATLASLRPLAGTVSAGRIPIAQGAGLGPSASGMASVARSLNRAIASTAGTWIAVVQAGDRLAPDVCTLLALHGEGCVAVYFDDDLATTGGVRYAPRFKPGFDEDLFATQPELLDGLCVFRRDAALAAGGFEFAGPGANFALACRLRRTHGGAAIARVARIGVHRLDAALVERRLFVAVLAGDASLAGDPLAGRMPRRRLASGRSPMSVRCVVWLDAGGQWLASLVAALLAQTGVSIVAIEPWCVEGSWTDGSLAPLRHPRVHAVKTCVTHADALNEVASRMGEDAMLVASERAVPTTTGVLEALASALVGDVAIACPRLVQANGMLHAAGGVIGGGPHGIVGGRGEGLPATAPGYLLELATSRRVGAVPEPFALVERRALDVPAPFDPLAGTSFTLADLCLSASSRSLAAWFEADATVQLAAPIPAKEVAAQVQAREVEAAAEAMRSKWGPRLFDDPCDNPNRPLRVPHASFDAALVMPWVGYPKSRLRVVAAPFDAWGSGQHRVRQPLAALASRGLLDYTLLPGHERGYMPTVTELLRTGGDALLVHHPFHDYQLHALAAYRRAGMPRIVVGIDDRLDALPPYNPYARTIYKDIASRIHRALELADLLVVSTEALAERFGPHAAEVVVIPNAIDPGAWAASEPRSRGRRVRVGWAGAAQHEGDLALVSAAVIETSAEVDWVFLGMRPPGVPQAIGETHAMVPFDLYPATLGALRLDVAIAPLAANEFNDAKSNVKLLEYGALGLPVIASDRRPYRDAPCERVHDEAQAWVSAIRRAASDPLMRERNGRRLRAWARREGSLARQLPRWLSALRGAP